MNIPKGHQTLMPYVIGKMQTDSSISRQTCSMQKLSHPTERPKLS